MYTCTIHIYMIFIIYIYNTYLYFFIIDISFTTHCLYVFTNCVNCQILTISSKPRSRSCAILFQQDRGQRYCAYSNPPAIGSLRESSRRYVIGLICCTLIILNTSFNSVCNLYQRLEFAHTCRIIHFVSRGCDNLYAIVNRG